MSKKLKVALSILLVVVVSIVTIIPTFFIVKHFKNKEKINNIMQFYTYDNIQNRIDTEEIKNADNLIEEIDGKKVLGVIEIEKINFKGLIYEGISLDILEKGVGHFEKSPYFNGNVCLAAHNSSKYWAKLHTLEFGDKIIYTSFLGSKEYKVTDIVQISDTDWSRLSNTTENILTLITCVKGKPSLRLCVQALEVN